MENEKKKLSRREFLKRLGASSASAAALLGMGPLLLTYRATQVP